MESDMEKIIKMNKEELKQKLQDFQAFLYGFDSHEKEGVYSVFIKQVGNFADEDLIKKWNQELKEYELENNFKRLNKKRTTNLCCNGQCYNNYISEDDTLICGKCEKEKHIDHFLESNRGYLCDECDKEISHNIDTTK